MTLDKIIESIKKAKDIVILTHESPDGDAVGSSLALYLALKSINKKVDVIIPEYPRIFNFLPGVDEIKKEGKSENYDLAISLDCADIKRLNGFVNYFDNANIKISIDHHIANTMFADYNYVNHVSPAAAQVLITIIEALEVEINKEIGTCICAGIISDTGGFQYPNVTAETFEFISMLLVKGVNVSDIYKRVLSTSTRANFELTRMALNRLEFFSEGKIAFTYITLEDQEKVNAQTGDHEAIVNYGRNVEGVEVSIFLRESENGYRASLRANSYVNVSDVCLLFNGGGHIRAAGCNMDMPFDVAKQKIIEAVQRVIK